MAPAQHMEMKMKHAMAAMYTGIDDEAVPGIGDPLLFCDRITDGHQPTEERDIRILKFGHRDHMFSGNNERMCRRLGIDIVERDHHIVFIDERSGNGPGDDFAKEALAHEVVPFLKPDFPNRAANS